jgi:hypothetical protein
MPTSAVRSQQYLCWCIRQLAIPFAPIDEVFKREDMRELDTVVVILQIGTNKDNVPPRYVPVKQYVSKITVAKTERNTVGRQSLFKVWLRIFSLIYRVNDHRSRIGLSLGRRPSD